MRGKRIIVSGAANGIGATIFYKILKEGGFTVGIDIQALRGSELERKLNSSWKFRTDFEFFQADAGNWEVMKRLFEDIGDLDGLVNNAGLLGGDISHGGRNIKSWQKMMYAHAQTAFVLTELSYPLMKNGGSIVNIGSVELKMAAPEVVLYTAAKGALWGLTIGYTTTLAGMKIRVNMVSPGNVNTERNKAQYVHAQDLIKGFEGRTPLGRSIEPYEVATVVLFLLSGESGAITGQNIVVDCGYTRALWDPSWTSRNLREIYKT